MATLYLKLIQSYDATKLKTQDSVPFIAAQFTND